MKKKITISLIIVLIILLGLGFYFWKQLNAWNQKTENALPKTLNSEVRGTVLLGPICPVVRDPPDPDCSDKPYSTKLVLTTADQSRVIAEFSSGADGKFEIKIQPGEYAIRSAVAANVLPYCSTNDTILVNANSYAETIVYCDTGIR